MIKTLLVDDNLEFRKSLAEFADSQPDIEIVGQADNGKEAIFKAQLLKPDLILMDISMSGMDGFKAAKLIKERLPGTKIIFLTVHREETYRYLAAMVDADGFVWKYTLKDDLPKRLQKIREKNLIAQQPTLTRTIQY